MKLRIIPMNAYDGCIPVTVYMVQRYADHFPFGKWVNIKGFSDKKKGSGIIVTIVSLRQTKIKQNGKREDSNRTLRRQDS